MDSTWWYVARASGIVAWALTALAVVWGLTLSTRVLGRHGHRPWLLDLHRFLGGLSVVFVGVHLLGLALDSWVDIGLTQVLVPFTSSWSPIAVSWGVVALYLLAAIEATSLLRRHIPRRWWHGVHLTSFGLYAVATIHLLTAGTDSTNPILRWTVLASIGVVSALTAYRVLAARAARGGRAPRSGRPGRPDQPSAPTGAVAQRPVLGDERIPAAPPMPGRERVPA